MGSLKVCRLCLAVDTLMYKIVNTPLEEIYERITSQPLKSRDGKPTMACYMCHHLLNKSRRFFENVVEAEECLQEVLDSGVKLTKETICKINSAHLKQSFGTSYVESTTVGFTTKINLPLIKIENEEMESDNVDDPMDIAEDFRPEITKCEPPNSPDFRDNESSKEIMAQDNTMMQTVNNSSERKSNTKDVGAFKELIAETDHTEPQLGTFPEHNMAITVRKGDRASTPRESPLQLGSFPEDTIKDIFSKINTNEITIKRTKKTEAKQTEVNDEENIPIEKNNMNGTNVEDSCFENEQENIQIENNNIDGTNGEDSCFENDQENIPIENNNIDGTNGEDSCFENEQENIPIENNNMNGTNGEDSCLENEQDRVNIRRDSDYPQEKQHDNIKKDKISNKNPSATNGYLFCDQCEYKSKSKNSLIQHIRCCYMLKPYYKSKSIQMKSKSTDTNSFFQCDTCNKKYDSKQKIIIHIANAHKPLLNCKVCKRQFKSKYKLEYHSQSHSLSFICEKCGKTYKYNQNLQRHMQICKREMFRCDLCDKSFRHKTALYYHNKIHKRYKVCTVCNKSYTRTDYLEAHMREHKGEKPHKCTLCNKSYTLLQFLELHMKSHSGKKTL